MKGFSLADRKQGFDHGSNLTCFERRLYEVFLLKIYGVEGRVVTVVDWRLFLLAVCCGLVVYRMPWREISFP